AVAADAHQYQPRVVAAQHVVAEPEPLERARTKVLDQEVGLADQLADELAAFVGLQVDTHGLLVAQHARAIERLSLVLQAHVAGRIAFGRLDLDDLGPEVRHQPGAPGTGDRRAHLDHAVARQRLAAALLSARDRFRLPGRRCKARFFDHRFPASIDSAVPVQRWA